MHPLSGFIDPEVLIGETKATTIDEVRSISVVTLTGATSYGGNSGELGNSTDTNLLLALRRWSDVVLVGGETVRAENYGGVSVAPGYRTARLRRGQSGVPPVAVVTRSFNFSPRSRLFTEAAVGPLFLAPDASCTDPALDRARKQVISAGGVIVPTGGGTATDIVGTLRARGHHRIICEGGARLLGQLTRAGLVDVRHVTIDPSLTLPVDPPLIAPPTERGTSGPERYRLRLSDVRATEDGCVFLRYVR
ncbi:pyrimidine reductase family protein [Corynebacterium pygosceleis]|uniref:Pyrimidine reductase family protein n=1 Tax=Corynebacterium pygosceleis TaxID=2800406 RepID=A0A9Q4C757_9CORY|nr:pyrimidine reductase family protein [Corynebacterium pygosceleis]MCK7636911.1 pyrimidine reductase family protein [Corynebacterium pygosceleis]MCK7674385.1 pyrimidine reductase family protein [Corynebacterium pygosceleis]MCL0120317.1 pyrimidine reductase family protein [Corynebacterium pygosceleis]MCX7443864.1 pyrimidine reductase family protein [Corynebacterium pygosceleis]MCX7467664.1 pyrimidine reductase family protein [Corynebacterium pygosceleis]